MYVNCRGWHTVLMFRPGNSRFPCRASSRFDEECKAVVGPASIKFGFRSRQLITLCGTSEDFVQLIREIDASTFKRMIVRIWLLGFARLRLLRLICKPLTVTDLEDVSRITAPLLRVASARGVDVRSDWISWPAGDRMHRRYVLVVDDGGRSCLFSKVSTDLIKDGEMLAREHRILRDLAATPLPAWRTPRSFGCSQAEGYVGLVLEPLPFPRSHLNWEAIAKDLPLLNTRVTGAAGLIEPRMTSWFGYAMKIEMSASFRDMVSEISDPYSAAVS